MLDNASRPGSDVCRSGAKRLIVILRDLVENIEDYIPSITNARELLRESAAGAGWPGLQTVREPLDRHLLTNTGTPV